MFKYKLHIIDGKSVYISDTLIEKITKICSICEIRKNNNEFPHWRRKCRKCFTKYNRQYRKNNNEHLRVYSRNLYKKHKLKLSDYYIKRLIHETVGVDCKDIPKELIELKRKQLKINRLLEQQTL